ncbi:MAG TPA: tripartite tricarboxylate transporter TctB family protein [Thermodesulfobacteriota bacterium]
MKRIDCTRGPTLSRLLGLVSLALAVTCFREGHRLWTGWAGSGVMPGLVGVLYVVLAIGFAVFPAKDTPRAAPLEKTQRRGIVTIVVAFAVYLALIQTLGFLLSTWAFLFVATRVMPGSTTIGAFLWAGALSSGSHLLFRVGLGTALPPGRFGF